MRELVGERIMRSIEIKEASCRCIHDDSKEQLPRGLISKF